MPTFYVDETGFTGEDLLEVNQPIFVQATHDFSEAETKDVIRSIFKDVKATELRHKALSRRPAHQDRVVELVKHAIKNPNRVATWVAHKEYAAVTMVVEWWVEPLAHVNGINMHKDGGVHALSNVLFICLEGFWDAKFRRKVLLAFQKMFRARTKERFNECRELIQKTKANAWGDEKRTKVIDFLWPTFDAFGFGYLATLPPHVLDLALPGLVGLTHCWRAKNEGPWEVVHDSSSNMARQQWLWDKLSGPDIDKAEFPGPHGAGIFPLNVTKTTFADSATEKQIQLCDILAGATAAAVRLPEDDEYRKKLWDAGIIDLVVGSIWPSADVTPKDLGKEGIDGNELIEWLSRQMEKKDAAAAALELR